MIDRWKAPDSKAEKFGRKVRDLWIGFCKKLSCYRSLGQLIPSSSVYTSLFCGAVKIIIQVCIVL